MIFCTWRNETKASGERRPDASVPMFTPTYGSFSVSAAKQRKQSVVPRFLKLVKRSSLWIPFAIRACGYDSFNQGEVVIVILPTILLS